MKFSIKTLALTLGLLAKMNTSVNAESFDIEAVKTEIGELKRSGEWPKGASASTIAYLTSIGQWPIKTSESTTVATSGTTPANDSCGSATEITALPFNSSGDTTHANTETVALSFCGSASYSGARSVWYKVTGTGGTMIAETVLPYDFDTKLHVYSGSCGAFNCIDGNDDGGIGFLSRVQWNSNPSEEYFILVHSFGGDYGQYNLSVTEVTDAPSSLPSSVPSSVPSDSPSSLPSSVPSDSPSSVPSSEPSWLDDEQCKKKDPEDDICAELDGRCKLDCEDDEDFICVPGLCSYDRNWDKPTKSPKMRALMEEGDVVDIEVTAEGSVERKLKATKAPSTKETKATKAPSTKETKATNAPSTKAPKETKATKAPKGTKAPKSSCECRVPRRRGCKN